MADGNAEVPTIDLRVDEVELLNSSLDAEQVKMMSEAVILVNEDDVIIGPASKLSTHKAKGSLHRAFSVLLFNSKGELLLQRRALDKITFPGIWANSCCSHPLHFAEEMDASTGTHVAAIRKLDQELGIDTSKIKVSDFTTVGRFHYMARMNDEWVEHELDHVIRIDADVELNLNPNEIFEVAWVSRDDFATWCAETEERGEVIAPWFKVICQQFLPACWPNDSKQYIYHSAIHRAGDVTAMLTPESSSGNQSQSAISSSENIGEGLSSAILRHKGAVESRIISALSKSSQPRLRDAMMHLIDGGGKRMRATLPIIVSEAVGRANDSLYDVGAAIEIIHNFTLVHDDIMDDDEIRRGRPAVHIAYDLPTAINAGDAMLAVGFEVLALSNNIPSTHLREVVLTISDMVRRVAEGQQLDISFEDRKTVAESEYIEMIEGKTAVMFRTCGRIGSLLSNASEDIVEIMTEWGLNVGLCFQLMDDLIDVLSDSKTLGKPAGSDLAQGKRTLMVIHALEQSDSPAKRDVLAALGKGEEVDAEILAKGLAGLHEIGSVAYARERAEEYHSIAHACLNKLPGDGDLTALRELTDFQLMRLS